MKLLFKDREEFENFCCEMLACPGDLGYAEFDDDNCSIVSCIKCWEQSGAEIIFENEKEETNA